MADGCLQVMASVLYPVVLCHEAVVGWSLNTFGTEPEFVHVFFIQFLFIDCLPSLDKTGRLPAHSYKNEVNQTIVS